ncbi:hypothetical protein BH09PSE2_BH09PSE2_18380 [soil metagenome]
MQAADLAGRKLSMAGGEALKALLIDMRKTTTRLDGDLSGLAARLQAGIDAVEAGRAWLGARKGTADASAGATVFLTLCGDVIGGWMHARSALHARTAAGDPAWLQSKAQVARFYGDQVLSAAPAKLAAVTAGSADLEAWAA